MNYLNDAFGGFNPRTDKDAAVKFSLSIIFMDKRLDELSCLLINDHEIGGVEGAPGWLIERRDKGSMHQSGYANWPDDASYRAYVDPEDFCLAYTQIFLRAEEFHNYVRSAMKVFFRANPTEESMATQILSLLSFDRYP